MARLEPRVRTLRVATGAHFLSFLSEANARGRTLAQALERVPHESDVVVNTEGLSLDAARTVVSVLRYSPGMTDREGRLIVVSREAAIRRLFQLSRLSRRARIEDSFEDALRFVLADAWLEAK